MSSAQGPSWLSAACSRGLLEAELPGPRQPGTHPQRDTHSSGDHTCFTHTSRSCVGLPSAATSVAPTVWLTSTLRVCALAHMCLGDTEQASQSGSAGGRGHVSRQLTFLRLWHVSSCQGHGAVFWTPIWTTGNALSVWPEGTLKRPQGPLSSSESLAAEPFAS